MILFQTIFYKLTLVLSIPVDSFQTMPVYDSFFLLNRRWWRRSRRPERWVLKSLYGQWSLSYKIGSFVRVFLRSSPYSYTWHYKIIQALLPTILIFPDTILVAGVDQTVYLEILLFRKYTEICIVPLPTILVIVITSQVF